MGSILGMVLGVVFGNRDFFPDGLVTEVTPRSDGGLQPLGIEPVALSPDQTKLGAVETWQDAEVCGAFFSRTQGPHRWHLVCLPNLATKKRSPDASVSVELNCPVLVQGCPDDLDISGSIAGGTRSAARSPSATICVSMGSSFR